MMILQLLMSSQGVENYQCNRNNFCKHYITLSSLITLFLASYSLMVKKQTKKHFKLLKVI